MQFAVAQSSSSNDVSSAKLDIFACCRLLPLRQCGEWQVLADGHVLQRDPGARFGAKQAQNAFQCSNAGGKHPCLQRMCSKLGLHKPATETVAVEQCRNQAHSLVSV